MSAHVDKVFVALKAFVVHDGKALILKESSKYDDGTNEGRFDFPGGRLTPGERFDEALIREIKEETGLEVQIGRPLCVNEWRPNVRGEQWQIVGTFFVCKASSREVVLSQDHEAYEWIDPLEYREYELIETNHPAFEAYNKWGED